MTKSNVRANPFIATRNHHHSELAEDYVEIVAELIEERGEARICDIVEQIGVSHVTVIRTIERLRKKGYFAESALIELTAKGKTLAIQCKERHAFLLRYLIALGVPEEIAKIDVEGMEHHISPETMACFQKQLVNL